MKRTNRLVGAALIAALTMTGCADVPAPTVTEQRAADYGYAPVRFKETIDQYFRSILKDPDSIQYREVTSPVRGYIRIRGPLIAGGKVTDTYGWTVDATINAKNSYGGYVGFKTYEFMFRGEEIVHTESPDAE